MEISVQNDKFESNKLISKPLFYQFLFGIGAIILSIFIYLESHLMGILVFAFGLLPTLLFLNYLSQSKGKEITFYTKKKVIEYKNNLRSYKYSFDDVTRIEIYQFPDDLFGREILSFGYCKYFLKSGEIIISNSLMKENEFFKVNDLDPVYFERYFPIINTSNKPKKALSDFDKLVNAYRDYTDDELSKIITGKGYRDKAKQAARLVINDRKHI